MLAFKKFEDQIKKQQQASKTQWYLKEVLYLLLYNIILFALYHTYVVVFELFKHCFVEY